MFSTGNNASPVAGLQEIKKRGNKLCAVLDSGCLFLQKLRARSRLAPGRRRSLRYVLLINVSACSVPVKILQNKHDREVEISNLEFNPSRPETVCVSGILTWDLVRMDSLLKHVSRGPFEVLLVLGTSVLASFLQSWRLPLGVNRTEAAGLHPDSVGHQLKTTNSSTF